MPKKQRLDGASIVLSIPGKKEYFGLLSILSLAASVNALWLAYTFGYINARSNVALELFGYGHRDHSIFYVQLRIGIALGICTFSFWLRTTKGLIISLLAFFWIGIEYINWYFYTVRWLNSMGVTDASQLRPIVLEQIPMVGGFYRGTWWNLVLLLAITLLFFWELKILLMKFLSHRASSKVS